MQAGELFVDSVDQQAPVREVNDEITTALCAFVLGDNPEGRPLLRDGEKMTITRYGVDAKTHQRPSPGVAALTVELVRDFVTTPNLKLTFNVMANPDEWEPIARQLNFFQRLQPFQFAVGGLTFGVFMQDWRHESPQHWIARIAPDREWHPVSDKHPAIVAATPEAQPLSRLTSKLTTDASSTAWLRHTRHALKHLHAPDVLMKNPLIELTIVRNMTSDTTHNTANINVFGPALAFSGSSWIRCNPSRHNPIGPNCIKRCTTHSSNRKARKNRSLNFSTSLSAHTGVICGRALTRWPSY